MATQLANNLIANCAQSPIRDDLIAGMVRSDRTWLIPGPPPQNPKLAVRLVLKRPAKPAAHLAGKITDTVVLEEICDKEKRLAVWLAMASNPNLPSQIRNRVFAFGAVLEGIPLRKMAKALLSGAAEGPLGPRTSVLEMLSACSWLPKTAVGSAALSDYEYYITQNTTPELDLERFVMVNYDRSRASTVLNRLMGSQRFEAAGSLKPEVFTRLFTTAHHSECEPFCKKVARRSADYDFDTMSELVFSSTCPTLATAVLVRARQSESPQVAADLAARLNDCLIALDASPDGFGSNYERTRRVCGWVEALTESDLVVDESLAAPLFEVIEHERTSRFTVNIDFKNLTPSALELMSTSRHPEVRAAATAAIADPVARAQAVEQMFTGEATDSRALAMSGLVESLANESALVYLATTPPDARFADIAKWIWAGSRRRTISAKDAPPEFVRRCIELLPAESLANTVNVLGSDYTPNLVDRTRALDDPTERAQLASKILTYHRLDLDDATRWALLELVDTTFVVENLAFGDPTDDPGSNRVVRIGELADLLAQDDPVEGGSRYDQAKQDLSTRLFRTKDPEAWMPEALRLVPIEHGGLGPGAWHAVGECLMAEFGNDKKSWELALGLLETWSANLDELIETVRMLST
jgi:hypothetical protein